MESPMISIVIPAYNEARIISDTLQTVDRYCANLGHSYEIILSDDGSTDGTAPTSRGLNLRHLKILESRTNTGKGAAVKRGIMAARGAYVLFSDADLSAPIKEFDKLFAHREKDIVIGSRALKTSEVQTSWKRKVLGRVGHSCISVLAVSDIKDTQCGFKLFQGAVARHLFSLQHIRRWGFDFEILYLAQKYGYSVKEVPVKWVISEVSRVTSLAYFYTLLELLQIHYFDLLGRYAPDRIPQNE